MIGETPQETTARRQAEAAFAEKLRRDREEQKSRAAQQAIADSKARARAERPPDEEEAPQEDWDTPVLDGAIQQVERAQPEPAMGNSSEPVRGRGELGGDATLEGESEPLTPQEAVKGTQKEIKTEEREMIKWVFDNLESTQTNAVLKKRAPSAGAWGLLYNCRNDDKVRQNFLSLTWPKLLPTKAQMELQEKFNDDGENTLELIKKLREALAQ